MTPEQATDYRVEHFEGVNNTPAVDLAVAGWMELRRQGFTLQAIPLGWDHNAFVAFAGQEPVGVLTYQHLGYVKHVAIGTGYVVPEWRGNRIYDRLWAALVAKARDLKAVAIMSDTHVDNATMRAVARRQGRQETGVVLRYVVEPTP